MRPYWFVLLLSLLLVTPVSSSEPFDQITNFLYSDTIEVGDLYYWTLVTYRRDGVQPSDYPYVEGNTFTAEITGDLNEDHTNMKLTVNEDENFDRILSGTTSPYLAGIIDYFKIIIYQTIEFGNGSQMNYFDFQSTFYPGVNSPEANTSQRIEDDEFVLQQSVRSVNFDDLTFEFEERYDYETGVLNFHNHTHVRDDGTIDQETLFVRSDSNPNISEDAAFLPFTGIYYLILPMILLAQLIRYKRYR